MSCLAALRIPVAALVLGLALGVSPAWAQDPPPVVVTGGLDLVNQYNFRGIRQNTEGVSIWPYIDFGFTPYRGDGGLKTVGVNLGTWNAFNSQINDEDFSTGNKWYESDLYATLALGFGTTSLGFTYTSYTSPADLFAHVKELAVKLSVDDSAQLGRGALKPYLIVAFELDDSGQADAGAEKGTYLELGVAPGYAGARASLAVPIKLGLSAGDYYEFGTGDDSTFGYFSIAGIVTVPMGAHANIHGGVEFQAFGDNVEAYNGQDSAGIASIGVGFAF
jgi:hypothetical protein